MKTLIKSYAFTLSLILFILISSILIACTNQSTAQKQPTTTESFTINNINYNSKLNTTEYYGSSNNSKGGIYFTDNEIHNHNTINTNDIVVAIFDSNDELISVNK